jgi:signal transduction histidine kinase/DNA-binding response OmpR family regulator/HAMP domain-containing protein
MWKLYIPFIFLFILFCGLGIFSLRLLYQLEAITGNLYKEITTNSRLENITKEIVNARYILARLALSDSTEDLIRIEKMLEECRANFATACRQYESAIVATELTYAFETFQTDSEAFFLDADVAVEMAIRSDFTSVQNYIKSNIDTTFQKVLDSSRKLRLINEHLSRNAFTNTSTVYEQGKIVLWIAIVIVSISTVFIARFMRFEMFVPILNLTNTISRLAAWDLNIRIPEQHRHDELGNMASSIKTLQQTASEQQRSSWIKAQLQEITQEIQNVEQIDEFAEKLLKKLTPAIEAQIAAFFIFDTLDNAYKLSGSYGFISNPAHPASFRVGEGLVGQSAADKTIKVVCDLPPDYISIRSGVVEGKPGQLVIAPILSSSEEVLAVIELALMTNIKTSHEELLRELLPILGLSLQVLERNQRTRLLLQESQRQAIELSKQSEQIFADQQEMQRQHDTLIQVNSELADKTCQLETTLQKLEEATRVKGIFLANMSHEIRTPMNAVIGMSHLCLKTDLNEKQKDYIEKIQQAGFSLLEIINNILDFSKLEDGNMKVRNSVFHMDELLNKNTIELAAKARKKGLEFITEIDDELPATLYGDQARIGQILHQLLTNAVKFTEKGQIRLRTEVRERIEDKINIRFEVRDTGIGMNQTQLNQLFQPFKQADESSTRQFSGTGIGLALAKRLVEMLGGNIQAKTEPGRGSSFSFEVWCQLASTSQQPIKISIEGMRVLVVDDSPVDQQILGEQLEAVGMRVEMCTSGTEAIAALKKADPEDPFAVAFMDWRLPEMDGIEIIRQIENLPAGVGRPAIIMVTAFEFEDVRDQAEIAGVKAFLPKPVTPSNLWAALAKTFTSPATDVVTEAYNGDIARKLRGLRVLLVEDNDLNQQIARELLQSVGISVTIADNGKIALELLRSAPDPLPYDLVLMDIQMPVMDGHQATIELRKDTRFKKLPIIALTAHAMEDEKQQCFEEGMNGHISKPIEPQLLFNLLCNWIPKDKKESEKKTVYLDSKAGLRRVAGNQQLYASLMQKFCEGQTGAVDKIRKLLAAGDSKGAHGTIHTLKGLAGNIGALALQKIAAEVEKRIKAGTDSAGIADVLQDCEAVFARTVAEICNAIKISPEKTEKQPEQKPASQKTTTSVDSNSAARVLKQLHYLLSQSDGEAEDYLDINEAALKNLLGETAVKLLRDSLSRFDFDAALNHLLSSANNKKIKI